MADQFLDQGRQAFGAIDQSARPDENGKFLTAPTGFLADENDARQRLFAR
jgi:hypothetical protein